VAKTRTRFVCQECGRTAVKALGRCPQCGAWNSMLEEVVESGLKTKASFPASASKPSRLLDVQGDKEERVVLPIDEFARVLGGGIVPGSLVLVGGEPGIGKSTLLLQLALEMGRRERILYVSGEESAQQLKARALRLQEGELPPELYILTETEVASIQRHVENIKPRLVIVDSIQTMQMDGINSSAGSITQVRDSASYFQVLAKRSGIAVFLVGHVTKSGAIAGPKVLEHIVDTVLYLEGDPYHAYRLLRSVKNRFGATSEIGVFEMGSKGLIEVANPSEAFLSERVVNEPGSAIAVTMEGTRPLLVEIQGLTSPTAFGNPRRTANGVDFNRLHLTLAVLTRRVGMRLGDQDVFVNVVGGLRVDEPAADLAVAASIASSRRDAPIPADLVLIGEVGLSGELRAVSQLEARLREAAKLGFKRAIVPQRVKQTKVSVDNLTIEAARTVRAAFARIWGD